MKFKFDHDFHIHSKLSSCSRDEAQSNERILQYAVDNGLHTIVLADHFWDETVEGASKWYEPQNYPHISQALPLPQAEGVKFLFGCETEMNRFNTVGVAREHFDRFDFVVIPTTHFHMKGYTLFEEQLASPETRADAWVKRLDALFAMDLPFHKIGIAHLSCSLIAPTSEEYLATLEAIPSEEMYRLFTKAAELGVGIELNMGTNDATADTVLRMYKIAKECGCKFYCGSDAHHPSGLDGARARMEWAIDRLGLTEDDKFHIGQ